MSDLRLKEQDFDGEINSSKCVLVNLSNSKGTLVQISNYGARIVSFIVLNDKLEQYDIVVGHDSLENYKNSSERYFNAVIGRYAGRICGGKFKLDDKEYSLTINNPPNHLHGGLQGLNEQVWRIRDTSGSSVEMSCMLPSGLDGYPGDLTISVRYTLTEDNSLMFEVHATCSEDSIINITNHAFFNLGHYGEDILDHKLLINAEHFLQVNEALIPTGNLLDVRDTVFDFRSFKTIGADIFGNEAQLKYSKGYDHSFVCDEYKGRNLFLGAVVLNMASGLKLEVLTNQPSVHFYSCNFFNGKDRGKGGILYKEHGALCLETQHFPDSPNQATFPSTVIKAGDSFSALTVYRVSNV